ncbi:MAG: DUF4301 family protein, partial [Muriicola sp.]|nr:DUF4301 family protein [Muriicola sp.]
VEDQIKTFIEGIPYVKLEAAAVVNNGILRLSPKKSEKVIAAFRSKKKGLTLLKFVPASGAASRMFKSLFGFLESYRPQEESIAAYIDQSADNDLKLFFENIGGFPFYEIISDRIKESSETTDEFLYLFVQEMLGENALNYGFYPKGLLPFHSYQGTLATPFEEHLFEGAQYAGDGSVAQLHFTISEQHEALFQNELNRIRESVSKETGTSFEVSYSFQKSSTDTIAVTLDNEPFRNSDNSLLFRPGGHGALIENLNDQNADIIFIKNIDNVLIRSKANEVAQYKELLAGVLLNVQSKVFQYAAVLEDNTFTGEQLETIKGFLENKLNVHFTDRYDGFTIGQQIEILKDKLHRPIRICGMVKNEGEPGGGPYWVRDRNGNVTLQIVESAQVDMANTTQVSIFKEATHFNPVDIVCGVKDYKGEKYNLLNFVEPKQGFITLKTKEGKDLKALELPGLWNGAMAYWNTIFVEVPSSTFNPVKTVNDLLKPAHRE